MASNYACPNNCHRYSKTIDEIFDAGNKHREKLICLKEITENQKLKISSIREEKIGLLDQVDRLELDAHRDSDMILRMTRETRSLKIEIRDLKKHVIEIEEISKEHKDSKEIIENLTKRSNDLEEELLIKSVKILELSELTEKKEFETFLDEELQEADNKPKINLEIKIKMLQQEVKYLKEKDLDDKESRNEQYQKMQIISESNEKIISSLSSQLKNIQEMKSPKCWFGPKCYRKFCRFDHSHVFRKDNRVANLNENLVIAPQNVVQESLCEECGNVFENQTKFKEHIANEHKEAHQKKQPKLSCEECAHNFDTWAKLNDHVNQYHQGTDIECEQCGIYFVSRKEHQDHMNKKHIKNVDDGIIEELTMKMYNLIDTKEEKEQKPKTETPNQTVKDFRCDHCGEMFMTKTSLKNHVKRVHKVYTEKSEKEIIELEVDTLTHNKEPQPSNFECGMCEIDFSCIENMDDHMDYKHGGRWKLGDKDVVYLGDEYEESFSTDDTTNDSESEISESQSGEVSS